MSTIDEIKMMQAQGMSETEIIKNLQEKGTPYRQISEALAQNKIKAAVEEPASEPMQQGALPTPAPSPPQAHAATQIPQIPPQENVPQYQPPEGMQKSMLQAPQEQQPYPQTPEPTPSQPQEDPGYPDNYSYPQQEYSEQGDYEYDPYQYQGSGVSSETIAEISEQIIAERLVDVRKHIEKVMDFKTTLEAKTESLDERLKRIEKILDTLQASVLRKVGSYVTDVSDIKKELIETQKTFAKLAPGIRKKSSARKSHPKTRKKHSSKTNHKKK